MLVNRSKLAYLIVHLIMAFLVYELMYALAETILAVDAIFREKNYLDENFIIVYKGLSEVFRKAKFFVATGVCIIGFIPFCLKKRNYLKMFLMEIYTIILAIGLTLLVLLRHYSFIWLC